MVSLEIDSEIQDFRRQAVSWLEQDSAIHSMILGLVEQHAQNGKPCVTLARGLGEAGELVAAGIQSDADRPLMLSHSEPAAAAAFARALWEKGRSLAGVLGPVPSVDAFADAHANPKKLVSNMRLFRIQTLRDPRSPGGSWRAARLDDEDLLFEWLRAFHREAVPHDPVRPDEWLRAYIRENVAREQYFLWEHAGRPACLVGSRRETARDRWIGPVYTPKELRGSGYASALVSAVSERILASGKAGMLFTDLANPTSNSIYQKIGYEPVADFRHYQFS